MKKLIRCIAVVAFVAFAFAGVAVAQDFYVVKDAQGKLAIADKAPADAKSVVKGPFKTKDDAEKALKAAAAAPAGKPKPPTEGC
jgi:hypothetical protein